MHLKSSATGLNRGSLFLAGLVLFLTVWVITSGMGRPTISVLRLGGTTMGTSWSLQLPVLPEGITENRLNFDITQILARLDNDIFSSWNKDSEVARFNLAGIGEPMSVSPELVSLLNIAAMVHQASGGAFDITIAPLVNLWGFGPTGSVNEIPQQDAIEAARTLLGVDAIGLSQQPPGMQKVRPVQIDLSAIAKGFAVDLVGLYLDNLGIEHYLMEIGGEVRLRGQRGERPWRLAIETPQAGIREMFSAIESSGEAMSFAGSGDYRQFFEVDGIRYSHTLDPRTGRPVGHDLAAVTVASSVGAVADAMATALLVLGPEQGFALASSLNLAAYFIIRNGNTYQSRYTEAFAVYLPQR